MCAESASPLLFLGRRRSPQAGKAQLLLAIRSRDFAPVPDLGVAAGLEERSGGQCFEGGERRGVVVGEDDLVEAGRNGL
jgi:hypothetical protein